MLLHCKCALYSVNTTVNTRIYTVNATLSACIYTVNAIVNVHIYTVNATVYATVNTCIYSKCAHLQQKQGFWDRAITK